MKTVATLAIAGAASLLLTPSAMAAESGSTVNQQLLKELNQATGSTQATAAQKAAIAELPTSMKVALLDIHSGNSTDEEKRLVLTSGVAKNVANLITPLKYTVSTGAGESALASPATGRATYAAAASGCKTVDPYITAYDFTGQAILYRWHLNMSVCYSGNKITRVNSFYHHITNWDKIWKDRGVKSQSSPGTGGSSTMGYMQGDMEQCPPIFGCSSEHYPAMNIRITASGGVSVYNARNN